MKRILKNTAIVFLSTVFLGTSIVPTVVTYADTSTTSTVSGTQGFSLSDLIDQVYTPTTATNSDEPVVTFLKGIFWIYDK